jgi:putative PIN family toxin of toxin-antitoxin system
MIVVLDTNVLVSGLMSPENPPGRIIDFLRAGDISLAIDDRIIAEYSAVLAREYFRKYFTVSEKDLILDFIAHDSIRVLCTQTVHGLPDPDDTCFLEVALAAKAPLITGNAKHFPLHLRQDAEVCTPAEFLQKLNG